MPRILIFDEQTVYRAGLRSFICAEIPRAEVIEASNLPQALDHIRNSNIDLVLVGTGRSSLAALDFLKLARETAPATRFVVVSASDDRTDILATLAAGFHGFISRHQSDTEILAAITDILAGRIYVPAWFAKTGYDHALGGHFDEEALPALSTEADVLKLTKRQREVLALLARGLSNKEIARALEIAEATTKIHMAALLRGLGVRNRTEAAFKAAKLVHSTELDSARHRSLPAESALTRQPSVRASPAGGPKALQNSADPAALSGVPVGRNEEAS